MDEKQLRFNALETDEYFMYDGDMYKKHTHYQATHCPGGHRMSFCEAEWVDSLRKGTEPMMELPDQTNKEDDDGEC